MVARAKVLVGSNLVFMVPWFAIASGMATPRLFLFFVRFEDSDDGFGDFFSGRPYQKEKPKKSTQTQYRNGKNP